MFQGILSMKQNGKFVLLFCWIFKNNLPFLHQNIISFSGIAFKKNLDFMEL